MISLIAAVARNGIIGNQNRLLWHISEDLRRFKALTSGHPVIMGRKTYESLGRPLPGRLNVVISRQTDYSASSAVVVHSLDDALHIFNPEIESFIIGGAEIYAQALPIADRLYLTIVDSDYEGDTRFPIWDPSSWKLTEEEHHPNGKDFSHPFSFLVYERKR